MKPRHISAFLTRCMLALFLAVIALALAVGALWYPSFTLVFLVALLLMPLGVLLLRRAAEKLACLGAAKAAALLALVCFLVKTAWILAVRPVPEGDYAVYWNTALELAEHGALSDGRYVALFPHIFGYSSFLSRLICIFGPGTLLAQWLNVALSVCAGVLLFLLGRCLLSLEAGISVFLLWIVCPSQTMYNSLILADLFYTTLLLAFLLIVTVVCRRSDAGRSLSPRGPGLWLCWLGGALSGLLLRLVNSARPIAAVPIIALLIWVLLLRGEKMTDKKSWLLWLPFLALALGVYAVTGPLWDATVARGVGEEPAGTPGYSVYVGFNQENSGTYNQADIDLLYQYSGLPGATARWTQEQMMEQAGARIMSGEIDFPRLLLRKLRIFLGTDAAAVGYNANACPTPLPGKVLLPGLCNLFYFGALMLTLMGGVRLWKRRERSAALLLPLFTLGLTLAQMLVEVAARYHYSLIPVFLLIGQFALFGGPSGAPAGGACPAVSANAPQAPVKTVKGDHAMADTLYIVIPCYNEEAVLPETARRLGDKLSALTAAGKIGEKSRVLFVNDGSGDRTWELIRQLHDSDPRFLGADLSRNRGHQNALLAGLMTAKDRCDMVISMDADLQDDVDAVDAMVDRYYGGCDIVYGVRSSRKKDTFFKRFTAEGFYRVMEAMGAETVFNHADYRLMSRRALEGLARFKEVNLFLRGIVPMVGYTSGVVEYERGERFAGESKYPLKKMLAFALEGITSLSTKPIRMVTGLGFLIFLVSVAMLIYSVVRWASGATIIGWASVICSVWAIGGLILLSLGVIGEYIGKIYLETKGRPRFLIRELLEDEEP